MIGAILVLALGLQAPPSQASDPNSDPSSARRGTGLRVFGNIDQPVVGAWSLEIPGLPSRRLDLRELEPGSAGALIVSDEATGEMLMRLERKKAGIGYDGQLLKIFSPCGFDTLPVSEFLPLGDAIVVKFESAPPRVPCPAIEQGEVGRFFAMSRRGSPVRLRSFSDISSSTVRESYSIGGDRPNIETSYELPLNAISVDDGSELRLLQRVKAPLDGEFWFQVEAIVATEPGVDPPRGYLTADSLRFVGSITLRRIKPAPAVR